MARNITDIRKYQNKPSPLSKRDAQDVIQKLAEDTGNIRITSHANERIDQRGFVFNDVLTILRNGIIHEEPRFEKHNWKYRLDFTQFDSYRDAACVVSIQKKGKLDVITVMWID